MPSGEAAKGVFFYSMVFIKKQPGDSPDNMIRKFSRKVMTEGIIMEMKKREFYQKPGMRRKFKKELARKFAKQMSS